MVFVCTSCGVAFTSTNGLKRHENTEHQIPRYRCGICSKGFAWLSGLKRHEPSHLTHKARPYKCDNCDKCFTRDHNLRAHREAHHQEPESGGAPKFQFRRQCRYCGKMVRQNNMARHIKTRHSDLPSDFVCPVCSATFSSRFNLQRHTKAHMK